MTISGPSSVAVGQTAQYTAGAVYSDGSSQTLTGVWWYTYENSATIDHATGILTGVAAGPAYVRFDYAPGGTITSPPPYPVSIGKTVTGLSISGPSSVTVGQTAQYTATVVYSDGSSQPLTSGPGWSTSNSSFATITQSGVVTAVAAGSVTVQAAYGGFSRAIHGQSRGAARGWERDNLCQPHGSGYQPGHAEQSSADDSAGRRSGQSGQRGRARCVGVDGGGGLPGSGDDRDGRTAGKR